MSRHLMGGTIIFAPTVPVPDWIGVAPPMPHYRFSRHDAEAVARYLTSLQPRS